MLLGLKLSPNYLINLVTTFLSQACSAGLIILLTPVLHDNFSINEFSNYGVLLNIILFTSAFDFGLNIGLMRRLIHQPEKASVLINSTFFFYLLLFFVAVPVFLLLFYKDVLHTGGDYLLYGFLVAMLVLQNMIATLFDVILHSANKIFVGKLIRVCKTLVEFIILFYCSKYGSTVVLLIASVGVNLFFIYTLFFFSKRQTNYRLSVGEFNWNALLDHVGYSFWYFLNSVGVVFVFNSQIIMLNALSSKSEVASYILVSRFLDVVRMGATNFATILFPSLAAKEAAGEWSALRQTYFKTLSAVFLMCCIILICLLTFGKMIFTYWSGLSGYETNYLYTIFSIFTILIVVDNVSAVFLHAFRMNRMQTIISIGQGILAMLLGFILVKHLGIVGFAIGSVIALLATNFFYNPIYLLSQFKKKIRLLS